MITYKNVNLRFNNKQIFQNFNLTIQDNEKILFNSPSGSGKTTLVKMLLGIIKFDGEIYIDELLLKPSTRNEFRKQISYVSQDVDLQNLNTHELIKEILSYKVNKHISYEKDNLISLFKQFSLGEEHLTKKIHELSGGERARVGLIIALLLNRKVLILDEITAGLDDKLKRTIINFICQLNKTVLIISHDILWSEQENIRIVGWTL